MRVAAVSSHRVTPRDLANQRNVACSIRLENLSGQESASFRGTILSPDTNGWTVFGCGAGDGRPLRGGESVVEDRTLECFAYTPSSGEIDDVDVRTLDTAWQASAVTFTDGETIALATGP
ncbi:MAG: hypothetical protein IT175_13195 [Acidobacteria bacterium]|nr:hypothetical protein [Acidobacteriota bacterium]